MRCCTAGGMASSAASDAWQPVASPPRRVHDLSVVDSDLQGAVVKPLKRQTDVFD